MPGLALDAPPAAGDTAAARAEAHHGTPAAPPLALTGEGALAPGASALPDIVDSTFDYIPATLSGTLAGVGLLGALYWGTLPTWLWWSWVGAWLLLIATRLGLTVAYRRAAPSTTPAWRRWRWVANGGAFASAAMWGLSAWVLPPYGNTAQHIAVIVIGYTFCVGAVPVLAAQKQVYRLYSALLMLPLTARIAMPGTPEAWQLAGILLVIFTLTLLLAQNYRQALQRAIALKLQADRLAAQLRIEKAAADAARQQAEIANRAKTQFFTAASHDLRQPLHAMGLFAEALRAKVHDDELAPLVNSINASVDALEGLFSELLDITRIDSGGVEVRPQAFEVEEIFRKLRLHFEPTAFEKGLALRLRGGGKTAFADPLLVERILRNLVSNAIRYTDDGGVLVGCRRRGDRLLLQVWDSGRGIPAAQQAKVFEEFYQLPGQAPSPEQRKGLGLGLAIVKRLADLLDAPLTLASEPGRGTVFTLALPVGQRTPSAPAAVPGKAPLALTLDGRTIVIVEDEPTVRSGLEVLLRGWGAQIVSFDSVAETLAWADSLAASDTGPDLVIADYRLEQGVTGVDAIQGLRRRFGAALPAIVVTGSTMAGHDAEAQAHDFHLLFKPVVPNKLRAMIAFKLGVKAGGGRG